MAATVINSNLLGSLRQKVIDMADHARYREGGAWQTSPIETKTIRDNGSIQIDFYIRKLAGYSVAERFQILDANDNVLVERQESVAFTQYVSEILYRFKLSVSAAENNE